MIRFLVEKYYKATGKLEAISRRNSVSIQELTELTKQLTVRDQQLRKSEQQMREVLESSIDASYKRNFLTNAYDYFSPVVESIFGFTAEEVSSMRLDQIIARIHPEDMTAVEQKLAEIGNKDNGETYHLNYRFLCKDGQYKWIHDRFKVIRDENKAPIALIGSVSDVTEQRATANALQDSESLFKAVFENAFNGLAVYEPVFDETGDVIDFKYYAVNKAFEEQTGLSSKNLVGRKVGEINTWLIESDAIEKYKQVYKTGVPYRDGNLMGKNGQFYDLVIFKVSDKCCVGVRLNITREIKAQMAFEKVYNQQKQLLDMIDVQIWYLLDPVTYGPVNAEHAKMLEMTKEDMEGQKLYNLLDESIAQKCIDGNRTVFEEKREIETRETFIDKKGKEHLLAIKKTPVIGSDGKVECAICRAIDLTEWLKNGECIYDSNRRCQYEEMRKKLLSSFNLPASS